MICPACRHPMMVVEYNKTELDYCSNCHGIWFDQGELELLLASAGVGELATMIQNLLKAPESPVTERARKCPICGKKMKKVAAGEHDKVIFDVCEQGHGLWFDGGEVDELVKILEDKKHSHTEHYHVFNFIKEVFKAPAK